MNGQADLRLAPRRKSVSLARTAVRNYAADLGVEEVADAELMVSELVSNAIQHGRAAIKLSMSSDEDGLLVSVFDEGEELPRVAQAESGPTSTSGRGLRIVQSLATAWGVAVDPAVPGKTVWFRLASSSGRRSAGRREGGSPASAWTRRQWSRPRVVRDMLAEVREAMASDTVAIFLVDRTRSVLEPLMDIGLGTAVGRAVRIPIGSGFVGRVAQTRQPVVVPEVDASNVIDPVLLERGVRSLLGVPIILGSELLGGRHVGSLQPRNFDAGDVLRLTGAASDIAPALHDQFIGDEHAAALTLQRSLLPTLPPVHRGLEMAARYVPAEGDLGGDWYDVFQLPDDRIGLVMGDVVGHGLEAAVVMGRLRSALRAYALEHDDPAQVLELLDRKISHFEIGALATVIYGVAREPFCDWRFSSAGHLLPVVAAGDGAPVDVAISVDPLLGLDASIKRRTSSVHLGEGGVLCVFTDGLVERRPEPGDEDHDMLADNLGRLRRIIATTQDPERVCVRALGDVVGDALAEDDIAILVMRRGRHGTRTAPSAEASSVLWTD
ncbi:MAG: SpoIIE family protein phosphatase [Marmoricola sp.]